VLVRQRRGTRGQWRNPARGGSAPTILNGSGNGITLASGNTLTGLILGNSSGPDVSGTSFGTLTVDSVSINSTGQAISLVTGAFAGTGFTLYYVFGRP